MSLLVRIVFVVWFVPFVVRAKCPDVRSVKNFNNKLLQGHWFALEVLRSRPLEPFLRCLRLVFQSVDETKMTLRATAKLPFGFSYTLRGNIVANDTAVPGRMNAEINEVPFTFVIADTDYRTYATYYLCHEDGDDTGRFTQHAAILSRTPKLDVNIIATQKKMLISQGVNLARMYSVDGSKC